MLKDQSRNLTKNRCIDYWCWAFHPQSLWRSSVHFFHNEMKDHTHCVLVLRRLTTILAVAIRSSVTGTTEAAATMTTGKRQQHYRQRLHNLHNIANINDSLPSIYSKPDWFSPWVSVIYFAEKEIFQRQSAYCLFVSALAFTLGNSIISHINKHPKTFINAS